MDRQLLLEATGTLLAFLVFYCLWKAKASTGISAPQPKGAWPVIGHLHLLGGKTPVFRTLAAMADKHGQIFTIQIGMRRALVVSGKETIMECFTTNDRAFVSRPKSAAAKYMGYDGAISALGPHGPYWRELRKVMTLQLLSNRRLELMKHLRATDVGLCINDLYSLCVKQLNGVSEGLDNFHKPGATKVDMTHWFRLATMNLMLRAIAGRRYGLSEDEKDGEARLFIRAMDQFMFLTGSFECSDVIPFIKWMDLQGHVRLMKQNAKVLDCFMSRWLEEHVQSRKNGQVKLQEQDFLDVFLSIFPGDGMEHGHTNKSIIKGNALDVLSLTEFELMEVLDVGLAEVTSAVAQVSEIACPPHQTVLFLLEQRIKNEFYSGHLPTRLKGLDQVLCGGIPFGVLTELVGPAGIGKTQFCMKLSLLASLPAKFGGLDGRAIYVDVESKFSSRRIIEIGVNSFPELFHMEGMAQEMAGRILVLQPASLAEFTKSLQQIKVSLLQHEVKLLVIDSMTALVSGEFEQGPPKQHPLGWHISFIKSLAEFSRIPVVVTNQVRSQSRNEVSQYCFQAQSRDDILKGPATFDSHLVPALGIHWAHAVTIRLVLEAKSGERFMKVAKSPISPPLVFPFNITSSGISLLTDAGVEMTGPQINTIQNQGNNDIINLHSERL